jgi:ribokinase
LGVQQRISKLRISVLPDFFLDRIVSVASLPKLFRQVSLKAASGGGNVRGISQEEIRGGNASNLAFALSSLSAKVNLFCVGNATAQATLSSAPGTCNVRVIEGRPGLTTALEFPFKGKPVNVMLSDVGGVANFDGRKLNREDIETLKKSDCIALVNWSANVKGNELASRVFSLSGRKNRLNFLDPADLAGAEPRIRPLLRRIRDKDLVDVISLNENEARILARILSAGRLRRSYEPYEIVKVARLLHDALQVTIDVHTPIGGASATGESVVWAGSLSKVEGFVTGAGDIWDAGDIIGHLLDFEGSDRLRFANACSYLYVTSRKAQSPSLREVLRFLH